MPAYSPPFGYLTAYAIVCVVVTWTAYTKKGYRQITCNPFESTFNERAKSFRTSTFSAPRTPTSHQSAAPSSRNPHNTPSAPQHEPQ